MTNEELDLGRLALNRSSPETSTDSHSRNKRKWLTRYLLPTAILLGFVGLVVAAAGSRLFPAEDVEVIPVIVKRATTQQSGTPLFQAAGWIEPRPTSINVPALTPGVIEELLVVEGQAVKKGDPIARLIAIDAEIAVSQTRAALANAEGELNRSLAEQRAAKLRKDRPIHLQVQLADAQSQLAKVERELSSLPFLIESAKSDVVYARKSVEGKRSAGNAVPNVVLRKAESELASANARLRELEQREPGLTRETKAFQSKVVALQSQLNLLVDETRQLDEANAKVESATANRDSARIDVQRAELALARNTIRAPIDGRILRLAAWPGMRVMGSTTHASQSSSTVVEMYDPSRLQVRADVRLEDVPLVQSGQPVEIKTATSEKVIHGRVLQPNSVANIQKNTLQVKVEILDPPDEIRPEMLATTTFLAPEVVGSQETKSEQERLFVPKSLLQSNNNQTSIWVVDARQKARRNSVTIGRSTIGDLVEVVEGLSITDKLISSDPSPLANGKRVNVTGENRSMGR